LDAVRKEAMDEAEKKARVEAQERAEQLKWEGLMKEREFRREISIAKAGLDAKPEVTREIAFQEAERRMKEEFELQKKVSPFKEVSSRAAFCIRGNCSSTACYYPAHC
jgi:hypothetical protein